MTKYPYLRHSTIGERTKEVALTLTTQDDSPVFTTKHNSSLASASHLLAHNLGDTSHTDLLGPFGI